VAESTLRNAERGIFREVQREASLRRYMREHVLLGKSKDDESIVHLLGRWRPPPTGARLVT
jgi:hypothetical protein